MVETEARTIYLFVLAVAKFSLHCAILAANLVVEESARRRRNRSHAVAWSELPRTLIGFYPPVSRN